MDLRQLKYFTVVVEEQNIGRAAARLRMSQPPLTRQIRHLEEEFGMPLLVRTSKGVKPTNAGLTLYEEARNILILSDRAAERTKLAGQGRLGRMDIGVVGSNVLAIPGLLLAFREKHPTVEVALHVLNKNQQVEALLERRITIAFSLLGSRRTGLVSRVIRRERLFVALNVRDPLSHMKTISLRDVCTRPLLLYTSGSRPNLIDVFLELFRKEGVEPQTTQEVVDSLIPAIALVAAGFGVCLVPGWAAGLTLAGVCFRPLRKSPPLGLDLHAIYRQDDASPILRAFLETVDEAHAKPATASRLARNGRRRK